MAVRLRRNLGATFVGKMAYAASQWILLIVLARLGGASEVGHFALALAIAAPIFVLAGLDLEAIQATDADGRYRFSEYLGLHLLALPLAVLTAVAVAWGSASRMVVWVVAAVAISKGVELVGMAAYGFYHRLEVMHLTATSLFLRGWLGVAAFGICYQITSHLPLSVVAMALIWAAVILVLDGKRVAGLLRHEVPESGKPDSRFALLVPTFQLSALSGLLRLALPAAVSAFVASLTVQVPRYALEAYVDTRSLGIFAALAYGVRVIEMVAGAMGTAMMPRLARHYLAGDLAVFTYVLSRMMLGAIGVGGSAVLAAALLGEPVLTLVYGADFARTDVLVRLMVAGLFIMLAKLLASALMAMRVLRMRMAIFVATLGFVSLLSALLVPTRGIVGAAEALVWGFGLRSLTSGVLVIYHIRMARRHQTQASEGNRSRPAT